MRYYNVFFFFLIFNFLSSLKESSFILGEANLYFLRDQTLKKKFNFNNSTYKIGELALYPPMVWPVLTMPTRGLKVIT